MIHQTAPTEREPARPEPASNDSAETSASRASLGVRILRALIGGLLPLVVVAGGVAVAVWLYATRTRMPERPPESVATLVSVATVQPTGTRVTVEAMGTVMAARETVLMPQVTGRIESLSSDFLIGGLFDAGKEILRIEKRDYELALEQRKSDVVRAEFEVKVEEGYQVIAKSELEVTGLSVDSESSRNLLLRKPHLKKVKASLKAANASREEAELDLARTVVRAPFNAVVASKNVDLGTLAAPQTRLCTLVGTDEYWVKVSLPVERLAWIRMPRRAGEAGSQVRVRQAGLTDADARDGHVVRGLAEVEASGRMASVLVSVKDPLGLAAPSDARPPLLIGAFVSVSIEGRTLENVIPVPRTCVHEGDRVWVMSEDSTLDVREVKIAWRDRTRVLVSNGLLAGERIVTSNIATPVQDMPLRVGEAGATPATAATPESPSAPPAERSRP